LIPLTKTNKKAKFINKYCSHKKNFVMKCLFSVLFFSLIINKKSSFMQSILQCLLIVAGIMVATMQLSAQCGCAYQFETTFPATVREAPVVIEGKLLHSDMITFGGDPAYLGDYKSTKIAVYKVLKGNVDAKEVELIEPYIHCSDCCQSEEMSLGESIGIFLLYSSDVIETPRNEIPKDLKFQYKTTWSCNFVDYNAVVHPTADIPNYNPYGIYGINDINNKVYQVAKSITGQKYKEIVPLEKKLLGGGNIDAKEESSQAVTITSINPTTITAGTFDTLTIRGSGFTDWSVELPNANDGGIKNLAVPKNHIVFSSDTMIKVLVPSVELAKNLADNKLSVITAGTGRVALTKGNQTKKSSQVLTVLYAESTFAYTDTSAKIYPLHLMRNTQNGDFMFKYHPNFRNNVAARHLFETELEKWRCATNVNFTVSCDSITTPNCDLNDNISTIAFSDNSCFANTLLPIQRALTQRRLRYCSASDVMQITAADIVFALYPPEPVAGGGYQTLDWYYTGYTSGSINSGQYDFGSTVLHELGHVQALEHVIKPTELLHYYSTHGASGAIDQLNPDTDVLAGTEIINRSADTTLCYKGIKKIIGDCALPTCANIGCTSPGYPLQVSFNLLPEHCLNNQDYLTNNVEGSWYQMVGTYATIIAKDQSMGNIVSRQWTIDSDNELFDNIPCNELSTLPDTCRSLYWTLPGNKNISLTVTDANGCTASYQQTITVQANCTLDLPITTSSHLICNPDILGCTSNQNIQLLIADLSNLVGSGCFRYAIEYNATDPTVSTATQIFTGLDLIPDETTNTLMLNCLQQGYYKISITDEVTTCWAQKIVYLTPPASQLPIIDQYTNLPDAGCSTCTGQIQLLAVNGNTDLSNYTFAWSVCPECNTTTQSNLCAGIYTITATDNRTGCSAVKGITINYDTGGNTNTGGIVTGLHISVEPTVFNDVSNVRIAMPEAGEVTIEVYNLNGVLVKKLVDKVYYTQGEFIIPHNATNLNDGLYVYRLNVCEKQKTDIGIKY
jgi:hypothetical protein